MAGAYGVQRNVDEEGVGEFGGTRMAAFLDTGALRTGVLNDTTRAGFGDVDGLAVED